MRILLLLLCIIPLNIVKAATYTSKPYKAEVLSSYSTIIIDTLWEQAGHKHSAVTPIPDRMPKPVPSPSPAPPKEEESPGQLKIKKIKSLNRQKLKKIPSKKTSGPKPNPDKSRSDKDENSHSKGKSYIEQQLAKNRQAVKQRMQHLKEQEEDQKQAQSGSLLDLRNQKLTQMKKQTRQTLSAWKQQVKETHQRWAQAREKFLKDLPQYKNSTFEIKMESSFTPYQKKQLKRPLTRAVSSDYHVIPYALDLPIRNQGPRPTCAAFAGIRAIEVLGNTTGRRPDLSEQFFYWSSKPQCQQSPCRERGSWISHGFNNSEKATNADIPFENSCPYQKNQVQGNETQTPLTRSCRQGVAQVKKYQRLYSLNDVVKALDNNAPVIAGFKLSPNFYKTKGLVTYKDGLVRGRMDSHAAGHALLIVGHMKLPVSMHSSEGKICFIVANSWSEGWGAGGHGCLTEKWVNSYRVDNAFVALNQVTIQQ